MITRFMQALAMIGVMVVWASFYSIIKIVVVTIDPLALSFLRYFLGLIPLTIYLIRDLWSRPNRPNLKDFTVMSLLGIPGVTGFAAFLFFGLTLSTAVNGSLLTNTQPVFTAILGPFVLSEVFSVRRSIGVIVGFIGMALVVTGGNLSQMAGGSSVLYGNVLLIGASLSLSLYSIFIKSYVDRFGSLIPTWTSMVSGTILLGLINLFRDERNFVLLDLDLTGILLVVYLGIIGTSLTYLVFNRMLGVMDVVVAMSYKMLIPVFGLIFAVFLLGERPNPATLAGVATVLIALAVVQGIGFRKKVA